MKQTAVVMAIFLVTAWLIAQSDSGTTQQKSETPTTTQAEQKQNAAVAPVEILSDTMGVNFKPYMAEVVKQVRVHWYNIIPPVAQPPMSKEGKLAIEFAILKDGSVRAMKLLVSSNDTALDRAAWGGIIGSNPFPPLPADFKGEYLKLKFYFFYNPPNRGSKTSGIKVSILPVGDVHLTPGSSHVFFADVTGTANHSVTWSISGPGCSGERCGTMTDGMYMAPDKLPSPPTVTLTATSQADASASASIEVRLSEPDR
jgi:TonB family protein